MRNSLNFMTMKKLTTAAAVLIAAATFAASSHALTAGQVQMIQTTVLGVPVPEMPAKAAELVIQAEKKDKQEVAVTVVRAVVSKHRAAAPLVIASISKAEPELAPVVAAVAAKLVPEKAAYIARAAMIAAPAHASAVPAAVNGTVPAANRISIGVREAAATQGPTEGTIRIDDQPINNEEGGTGTGEFPQDSNPPNVAPEPVRVYDAPQP